jgi:hypothetical protein
MDLDLIALATDNAHSVGAVVGTIAGLWTLAARLHKSFMGHLASHFASKQELEQGLDKLGEKVDSLTTVVLMQHEAVTGVNVVVEDLQAAKKQ